MKRLLCALPLLGLCGCEKLPAAPEKNFPLEVEGQCQDGLAGYQYTVLRDKNTERRYLLIAGSSGALSVVLMAKE